MVAWNRAVGRVLDVGPSQLHAYFVLYQLHQYRHAAATTNTPTNTSTTIPVYEANLPDLEHILKESASKMKPAHIEVLGLLITGVAPSRVEELKGLKLLSFPVTTATATAATPEEHHRSAAIPWAASESLLTTLLTALRKGSNSGETSTRAGRGASAGTSRKAREVSGGTETSSSSGGPENDQLSQLVARLLDFGAGVANLPTDILQDLYSSRFGDTEAMEALLPPILLREDISPTAALEACASLTTYHADLCKLILSKAGCSSTLLSQLNDSAEVDVKIEQTLHAVWLQQVSQLGQRCAHGDVEEVFLHHCSAFHSLLHKASNLLNQVALRRFSEVVIATLSRLASAKSTDSDVAPISPQSTPAILLGEVSLADHVQWIAAGVVSAVAPGGLALLVGIHVLTHWGLELQRADQQEEDVVAGEGRSTQLRSGLHARSLLLSRLLLASLHSSTETALFRDICLASSSVPSSTGHSTDNVYDIEDPAQWDALVVTLLESDDGISAAHLQIILALHQQRCVLHQNLCTLVDGSADTSVVQLFSLPLKLQYLQRAFAIHHVTEPTSSPPVHACASSSLSMPTCAKMLKALAKVQMHGEFVQFMLVDMQLLCGSGVQGGDSPQWRQNARIMDIVYMLLPERSCWKRQVRQDLKNVLFKFWICFVRDILLLFLC